MSHGICLCVVCVSIYVCMHLYVCMYICMFLRMYVCCQYVCVYVCVYMFACFRVLALQLFAIHPCYFDLVRVWEGRKAVYINVCRYLYLCLCLCMYMFVCMCKFVCTSVWVFFVDRVRVFLGEIFLSFIFILSHSGDICCEVRICRSFCHEIVLLRSHPKSSKQLNKDESRKTARNILAARIRSLSEGAIYASI